MKLRARFLTVVVTALAVMGVSRAAVQDIPQLEQKVTVHKLDNGWTFIIYERPVAPVFSFATYVNVGSAQEVPGITGLAHMFEHMAFKGTPRIGTNNYKAEKAALDKVDAAYAAYMNARNERHVDEAKVAKLKKAWKDAEEEADRYVESNQFEEIIDRNGGVNLNAGTGADSTVYFYSLPSNKTELWASLDSDRFREPVFREFYKERDVVKEERRLRTESQPIGRLIEQFVTTAFIAHPYHHPVVGYMSDLDSITRQDAEAFYNRYYVPSNMVTAIVGDVKAAEIIPIIDKYFGRIPGGDAPPRLRTVEPKQTAEKIVRMVDPSQPVYAEAYHKGSSTDPDEPVFDAISDILSRGRTSRLYRSLVRDKKIAVAVQSLTGFPGEKYPNLYIVFALPAPGHSNEEVRDAIRAELRRLKDEDVSDEELAMVKTRAKASVIRSMDSNLGLASNLAQYQTLYGDWKELFHSVDKIETVTKADIRRVAARTFVESNRTVGMIVTQSEPNTPADQPGQ
ncbi:MAG: M16 family metallopeptidase [Acidobacteriota bacterium]